MTVLLLLTIISVLVVACEFAYWMHNRQLDDVENLKYENTVQFFLLITFATLSIIFGVIPGILLTFGIPVH